MNPQHLLLRSQSSKLATPFSHTNPIHSIKSFKDYEESVLDLEIQFLPHSKHSSIIKTNVLMLYTK
jgi:hypothetical protein